MSRTNFDTLLEAGCHFGHLKRKWNPSMAPYIFMERNGIHIIDLHKTVAKVDEAADALKQIAKSGKKVLFVATKKQAKQVVAEKAASVNMPYVIERWPGGMLTNFPTIRKAVKKMATIDKLTNDGTYSNLSKREVLQISRQRAKLEKNLGSIADLTRLPSALFVIDVLKENIAVREANRLGIPVFAIVDTNSDPSNVDFVIPANDDATKSVEVILDACCGAIAEGLEERKAEKIDMEAAGEAPANKGKKKSVKARLDKSDEEAIETILEAVKKAGYEPGKDFKIAMDAASSEWKTGKVGEYKLPKAGTVFTSEELIAHWKKLVEKYPIISIEDALDEEDWEGWKKLTAELGDKVQLVGDDLFVTNTERLAKGISLGCGNSILIKLNQIGSVSETLEAIKMAHKAGYTAISSHRSGETEDTTIADLAVALNTCQIKTGAPSRTERVAKYNQLLRIEEELGAAAVYPGMGAFNVQN